MLYKVKLLWLGSKYLRVGILLQTGLFNEQTRGCPFNPDVDVFLYSYFVRLSEVGLQGEAETLLRAI